MTGSRLSIRSRLLLGTFLAFMVALGAAFTLLLWPWATGSGDSLFSCGPSILAASGLLLVMLLAFAWKTAAAITAPLRELTECFKNGNCDIHATNTIFQGPVEISLLATSYNQFMTTLEESRANLRISTHNYQQLFENAVEGIFQSTSDGRLLTANPSLAAILGYDDADDLRVSVGNVSEKLYAHPEDRKVMLRKLAENGLVIGFEVQLSRKDGGLIWASLNARGILDDKGNIKTIEGFITDTTKRHSMEESLVQAKAELEGRVEERTAELTDYVDRLETRNRERTALQEMITLVQECDSLTETYPVVERFMEEFFPGDRVSLYMRDEQAKDLRPVFSSDTSQPFRENECWALHEGKPYLLGTSGKRPRCAHITTKNFVGSLCVPLKAHDEYIGLLHVLFRRPRSGKGMRPRLARNIADHLGLAMANLQLRESLRLQSIQDPLTRLFNRRYLEEALVREFSRADRKRCTCAVLMVDLDHFKRVNDEHGHDIGDLVLQSLAEFLRTNTRSVDIPCRFGGEEFVVIMNELTLDEAKAKAEELCRGIREHVRVRAAGLDLRVTASLGVALYPLHGTDPDEVVKASDDALYRAKDGGRDRVEMAN